MMVRSKYQRLALWLCLLPLIVSCVYVPPVWDLSDRIHDVGSITVGVTTKQQVLAMLGEPDAYLKVANKFSYYGHSSYGGMCIYGMPSCGLIGEEPWWISVTFDENDVVSSLVISGDDISSNESSDEDKTEKPSRLR